jgi:hypothetical protein
MYTRFISIFGFLLLLFRLTGPDTGPDKGIRFVFKGHPYHLNHKIRLGSNVFGNRPDCNNLCQDTLSNRLIQKRHYVEIIRQDDSKEPHVGIALGFEFDESNGEFPYTPSYAVMQLKDFGWGGVEFSRRDTSNYTGVSDNVSNDFTLEVDSFKNNVISGRFSGLLLSGAGPMASVDTGIFRILLYRQ